VECVRKIRLSDLNVYSPKRAADWRVSVNLEVSGEHFPSFLCLASFFGGYFGCVGLGADTCDGRTYSTPTCGHTDPHTKKRSNKLHARRVQYRPYTSNINSLSQWSSMSTYNFPNPPLIQLIYYHSYSYDSPKSYTN
jgi:hypothetical protein